jgi:radical SAM enzyme (TIGR01210 family)
MPTPRGSLPAQLERALGDESVRRARPRRVKLYNASNFFDPRAVPPEDLPVLANLLERFDAVTVECHPRLVGAACLEFAGRLSGRLEVAMGIETVHPEALARLNKDVTLDDFDRAADSLRRAQIGIRAFALVGAPFIERSEQASWVSQSAAHAAEEGAEVVALIPVRGGNGELERLAATGDFIPPTLADLERALESSLDASGAIVIADLWDAEGLPGCRACRKARIERLRGINRSGEVSAHVRCKICGGETGRQE